MSNAGRRSCRSAALSVYIDPFQMCVCVYIYVISECPELETKKLCYTLNIFIFIYELKKYFLLELRTANIIKEDKICISFLVSQSYLFLLH